MNLVSNGRIKAYWYAPVIFALIVIMAACTPRNGVTNALDEARRLTAEGNYEEALQKHILFHDHILETHRSYYGVRLSFALADWVALGEKYPKAREALIEIRDKKATRLYDGEINRELFHDVESINDYLDQSEATVVLFKKIEAASPEFAATIYDLAEEALVKAGEYSLARKYLGDPLGEFAKAKESFQRGLEFSKTSSAGDASRSAYERIFTEDILRLISILRNTGDVPAARSVQSEALKVLENRELREALSESKAN